MTSWKGKTRGGLAGYKIFISILRKLGLPFAYLVLKFVVVYFIITSPKSFRCTFLYFRRILKHNFLSSLIMILKNYYIFGQVLLDKISVLANFPNTFTYDFDGEENLRKIVKEKKGGVLISLHIGNWEIAGQLLERLEARINIVMLNNDYQKIKTLLDNTYMKKNVNFIAIKDDFSHLFAVKNALQNKEIIAIHGDRYIPGTKTIKCKFLGKDALFPSGPLYLASKYSVPVSFVSAMKETDKHYHFFASAPKTYSYPANLKTRNTKLKAMIEEYISHAENILRKYPLQWFNYYLFWESYK